MNFSRAATCVTLALVALGVSAVAAQSPSEAPGQATILRNGGAAGGDAFVIPDGDILNVRNIQGGMLGDPNLDIGAGSSTARGTVSLNYDVGRCTVIFDGRKRRLASFCPHRIVFYVRPSIRRTP